MKLSFAALSLAVASVQGSSLRASANNNNNSKILDSEVIQRVLLVNPPQKTWISSERRSLPLTTMFTGKSDIS